LYQVARHDSGGDASREYQFTWEEVRLQSFSTNLELSFQIKYHVEIAQAKMLSVISNQNPGSGTTACAFSKDAN